MTVRGGLDNNKHIRTSTCLEYYWSICYLGIGVYWDRPPFFLKKKRKKKSGFMLLLLIHPC